MSKQVKISTVFPKYLFWDMDYEKLDSKKDLDIIIPRALFMTNKSTFDNDIKKLENIYSKHQIINHLQKTKELISNEVCEMIASRYSILIFFRFSK